jgi:hypothetical protein
VNLPPKGGFALPSLYFYLCLYTDCEPGSQDCSVSRTLRVLLLFFWARLVSQERTLWYRTLLCLLLLQFVLNCFRISDLTLARLARSIGLGSSYLLYFTLRRNYLPCRSSPKSTTQCRRKTY